MGYPARAIGGARWDEGEQRTVFHTWNQIWFPELGWVDFDPTSDNGSGNDDSYRFNGQHPEHYTVTFIGEFKKRSDTVFSQRNWVTNFNIQPSSSAMEPETSLEFHYEYR